MHSVLDYVRPYQLLGGEGKLIKLNASRRFFAVVASVTLLAGLPTVAAATGSSAPKKDTCGYPDSSSPKSGTIFTEQTIMRGASVLGQGTSAQIAAFADDEAGVLLGVNGASAFPNRTTSPYYSHLVNPNLGDTTKNDASVRPLAPVIYITKITSTPTSRAGDWQQNPANKIAHVNDVFGSWATGTLSGSHYTWTVPTKKNNWNGVPDITAAQKTAFGTEGFGFEARWNVSDPALHDETGAPLTAGNKYRFQIFTHDGDQNRTGGDVGEICSTFTMPGAPTIQTKPNGQTSTNINSAIGGPINDTAVLTGSAGTVTGTVTFNLYFQPNPQPVPACATPGSIPPGTKVFTETKTLVSGQATSSNYNTSAQNAFGVYYWQDVYNPPSGGSYASTTEPCGHETETVVDARIKLAPASATNFVNAEHVLTATVESTTDGTNFSPVPGATVTFSLTGGSAVFTDASSCGPTDASGECQVSINSAAAGDTTIHASATNFTVANTVGTFTRSTGSGGYNDPDATKTYVNQVCPGQTISTTSDDGSASSGQVTANFTFVEGSACKSYTTFEASSTDEGSSTGKSITFLSQQLAGAHITASFDWGYFPNCRADATEEEGVPPCPTTLVDFGDETGFHPETYCAAADPENTTTPWCTTSRTVTYLLDPGGSGDTVAHITETWDGFGDIIFRH